MSAARPTRTGSDVDPPSQRRPAGVEELVHPHGQDQDRHHQREARVRPAGREDPADDQPGVGQALRPEEDPGEGDEREDRQLLDQPRNPFLVKLRLLQLAGQAAAQGVQAAPDDERPGRTVPDARDDHRDEHIDVSAQRAMAAAAQREVDVILEPGGQADVPAVPEIAQARGRVGVVEVQHHPEAHQQGDAAGHVGVAAEVEVDLPAERHRRQDQAPAPGTGRGCRRPGRHTGPGSRPAPPS